MDVIPVLVPVAALLGLLAVGALVARRFHLPRAMQAWRTRTVRKQAASRIDRFATTTAADNEGSASVPLETVIGRAALRAVPGGNDAAWNASIRLRRLTEHVAAQGELVDETGQEIEAELEPLRRLLIRQQGATALMIANLGEQLETVRAFNANEESNLRVLRDQMNGESMRFVAHSFSETVRELSERIEETRKRIDSQSEPFERFALDERGIVEYTLEHLDEDIDALEEALATQRKVATRLLEKMRAEPFAQVRDFLVARQTALDDLAESHVTDPSEIGTRLRAVRGELAANATQGSYFGNVLERAASVDDRLVAAGTGVAVRLLPLPEDQSAGAETEVEADARPAA